MASQDPFDFRYGPTTPSGPRGSQPDDAPPLPPRPHLRRRPVASAAAASQQVHFPPRDQFGGSSSGSPRSTPTYNFSPPNDPPLSPPTYGFAPPDGPPLSPPTYGFGPPNDPSGSFSPPAYSFGSSSSFAPGPSQATFAQAPARSDPAEYQPKKRHSVFGSTVRQLAKVVAALANPDELSPNQPTPYQPAPSPAMQASQVIVNGVVLGQADLLTLQGAVGTVSPGSYW